MPVKQPLSNSITEGSIWKQLLLFFFPILMGSFFQQMYTMADTIIVGRALGTQALAAVGSSSSLINLVCGFFIGLSSGATVLLSQYFGAGDGGGTQRALHTGMVLSLILGILTILLGLYLGPAILRLIRTPETCMAEATVYTQVYFTGSIASMAYNMGTGMIRAMGDSRRPTLFLIFSCFLNILLDLLFVSCLELGVAGAAAATVVSQHISALLVILYLCRLPRAYRLRPDHLSLHPGMVRRILLIGIPAGLQFITYDFSNLISQSSINSFGDVAGAAWIAYIKSDSIIWMVMAAFGAAITTFVGQNYGARKYDRIRQGTWVCMALCTGPVVLLCALEVVFREWILGIYTTDPQVIRTGARIIAWAVPFCFLFIPVEVLGGAMRGTGYSLVPTLITTVFACVFRVAWVWLVVERWHSLLLLVLCYPVSWLLCAIVFFAVYFRGRWLKPCTVPR